MRRHVSWLTLTSVMSIAQKAEDEGEGRRPEILRFLAHSSTIPCIGDSKSLIATRFYLRIQWTQIRLSDQGADY